MQLCLNHPPDLYTKSEEVLRWWWAGVSLGLLFGVLGDPKLDDFVFHDFRHVAISNLRKAGNSPTVIMKASGHKTMSMFIRYNLVDEEDLKGMKWIDSESESNNEDIGAKIKCLDIRMMDTKQFLVKSK